MITIPLLDKRDENNLSESCCSTKPAPCCSQTTYTNSVQNIKTITAGNFKDKPAWISNIIETTAGTVPVVTPYWTKADFWGQIRSRIGSFRMDYIINPGLYAIGTPDTNSDVIVSANYKLSFDVLRRELSGINAWLLVLDTKGINVWCAAGKGTFGTDGLVKQIIISNLPKIVSHKRLIVPQLGAVGVKAAEVKRKTGFNVHFGPVEASDIKEYLHQNYQTSPAMRKVKFTLSRRTALTLMELNPAFKKYPLAAIIILILLGIEPSGIIFKSAWYGGWPFLLMLIISILTGAFFTPVLLPVIPFRSFALKGAITGLIGAVPLVYLSPIFGNNSDYLKASAIILTVTLSSYLALQFTGATTYTGISGVKKELRFALPLYMIGLAVSIILFIIDKIIIWGII